MTSLWKPSIAALYSFSAVSERRVSDLRSSFRSKSHCSLISIHISVVSECTPWLAHNSSTAVVVSPYARLILKPNAENDLIERRDVKQGGFCRPSCLSHRIKNISQWTGRVKGNNIKNHCGDYEQWLTNLIKLSVLHKNNFRGILTLSN